MKFVFFDKDEDETDIIIDILKSEKIPFKLERQVEKFLFFFDDDEVYSEEYYYNIICNTDLHHYEYVKYLSDKKIAQLESLEKSYLMKVGKKNVQRVSKKGVTDTDKRDKSK